VADGGKRAVVSPTDRGGPRLSLPDHGGSRQADRGSYRTAEGGRQRGS